MSKQIHIFATHNDLIPGLREFEATTPVQYVLKEMRDDRNFKVFDSLTDAVDLGISRTGHHVTGDSYLVLEKESKLEIDEVRQISGRFKYLVHQNLNPTSITFEPGGMFQNVCLVVGHVGTASPNKESDVLYKRFRRAITKTFQTIGRYHVGPEAMQLLQNGFRLVTMHVNESKEYDLKL